MAKKSSKKKEKKKSKERATFTIEGEEYYANPSLSEFLDQAGFSNRHSSRIETALGKVDISKVRSLLVLNKDELEAIRGISAASAKKIKTHATRVRNQGDILTDYAGMKVREADNNYLPTGSTQLDEMLTYSNGKVGWRSRTLVELFGEASMGKTQICMTAAAMCLRSKEEGGWGKGIVYIDSEGAFEGSRFEYLARYWGVDQEFLKDHLLYSRVDTFDDVEKAVDLAIERAEKIDLGVIVVDSIMDPLKSQYILGGDNLSNLQPRQRHLKQVLDKLKFIANTYNAIAFYTNHVRAEIGNYGASIGPQGGSVIAHASDIRIYLSKPTTKETKKLLDADDGAEVGVKGGRAKIDDCGFLPEDTGFFLIGPMGIADPDNWDEIYKHAKKINKEGYLCVNARGEVMDPLDPDHIDRSKTLEKNKKLLYGTA